MKNVAVFGAGRIGRIHSANLAALGGVKLKYVSDPVPAAAAELAAAKGQGGNDFKIPLARRLLVQAIEEATP